MAHNVTHALAVEVVGQGPCCGRCISTPVSPHSPFHAKIKRIQKIIITINKCRVRNFSVAQKKIQNKKINL